MENVMKNIKNLLSNALRNSHGTHRSERVMQFTRLKPIIH